MGQLKFGMEERKHKYFIAAVRPSNQIYFLFVLRVNHATTILEKFLFKNYFHKVF